MPNIDTTHRIAHSADAMFALVADVERYPEFVPLCQSLTIVGREERKGRDVIEARMSVGYKAIRETFTSRVVLDPASRTIDVSYVDGPFEYLANRWVFTPLTDDTCEIHFTLDYAFKSRALSMLMGATFDRAFSRVVQAFEQRADELHRQSAS
ncbi:type II toxin-antitoxin system RatA family toxin [Rhizobiaceae bacterium]|nr:type II toxin-antitoxin system RatA family toxin [Rhizobiaceae bacterium]